MNNKKRKPVLHESKTGLFAEKQKPFMFLFTVSTPLEILIGELHKT